MSLINTNSDIKKYIVVDQSFNVDNLSPYFPQAENQINRILGQLQFDELEDYFESQSSGITELDDLLPIVQRPLVIFSFLYGLDSFNVSIGNNGIAVVSNTSLAPASKDRVESLRSSISEMAFDSLEDLLLFLESNIADYPLWESSESFANQYDYLICSARIFDTFYPIKRSRLSFLDLRPTMYDVESFHVAPVISAEFLSELKTEISSDSVSDNNNVILPDLQKSLAYISIAEKHKDNDLMVKGKHYLMNVKTILDGVPDNYPTYKNSIIYDATIETYQPFENDEDNNLIILGI